MEGRRRGFSKNQNDVIKEMNSKEKRKKRESGETSSEHKKILNLN